MSALASQLNTPVLPRCRPYYIGSIRIDPPVVLAPMADVTNGAFRRLVKRIGGPGLVVTELISTMAIHYKSARTMTMFDVTEDQHPLAVRELRTGLQGGAEQADGGADAVALEHPVEAAARMGAVMER